MTSRSARPLPPRSAAVGAAALAVAALLLAACGRGGGSAGDADEQGGSTPTPAVSAQARAEAKAAFPVLLTELQAADTAYASGNAAEAKLHVSNAKTQWAKVTPAISTRETSEVQLLFDNLSSSLDGGGPASQIHNLVSGMVNELNADIKQQLG